MKTSTVRIMDEKLSGVTQSYEVTTVYIGISKSLFWVGALDKENMSSAVGAHYPFANI